MKRTYTIELHIIGSGSGSVKGRSNGRGRRSGIVVGVGLVGACLSYYMDPVGASVFVFFINPIGA